MALDDLLQPATTSSGTPIDPISGVGASQVASAAGTDVFGAWRALLAASGAAAGSGAAGSPVAGRQFQLATRQRSLLDPPVLAAWQEALAQAEAVLAGLPARSDYAPLLQSVFGGAGTEPSGFAANLATLAATLRGRGLRLQVEIVGGEELRGNAGAYLANGPAGRERILINGDWLASGVSAAAIAQKLIEEAGHAIDERLNPGGDSPGDEGELLAALLSGASLDGASRQAIAQDNDQGQVTLAGTTYAAEFGVAAPDKDGDGVADATDLDDDNDGILDGIEQQKSAGTTFNPSNDDFRYAQNTFGYQSFHSAALEYKKGTRNDPYLLFDGLASTELRVHTDDVYEFRLSATPIQPGSSFTLEEADGGNDAKLAVLGSLGTTDANRNTLNATGGGKGWATIRANFDGITVAGSARAVNTVADLETLFNLNNKQPLVGRNNSILLFAGPSDKTETFTTSIAIDHFQIVGLAKHGGWSGLTLNAEVDAALDTDRDGISNNRDLDSDNDGISDLAESVGWSTTAAVMVADANRDGTITKAEATTYMTSNGGWLGSQTSNPDFNGNGLWDFLENGGTDPLNSDADSLADFLDLDSDGDGIPDTVELQASSTSATAYLANDGDVRGEDADGDGVIARFDDNDATTAAFGGSFKTPVNTDASKETGSITAQGTITNAKWIAGGADWQTNSGTYQALQTIAADGLLDSKGDSYAKLKSKDNNKNGDNLVVDFGRTLSAGTTIRIRAASNSNSSASYTRRFKVNAASNISGTDITGSEQTFTFGQPKQKAEDFTYTVGAGGLKYLEFTALSNSDNSDAELRLDYVGWTASQTATTPDYLDLDSENDGLLDRTEFIPSGSKLSLTGKDTNNDGLDDGIQTDGAVIKSYEDPDGLIDSPYTGPNVPLKNNDADGSDVDYRSENTGAFTVSNLTVNEGSPYAVFAISRPATTGANVQMLLNITGTGTGFAKIGDASTDDVERKIEYFNGTAWVAYTSGGNALSRGPSVLVPGNRPLLVRVPIRNDGVFEGPEIFRLEVRNPSSPNALVDANGGFCTIVDNGTGDVWLDTNTTPIPDANQPLDDDRRLVTIDDLYINEGNGTVASPRYAVFTLSGNPGQTLTTLTLQSGTATAWNGTSPAIVDKAGGTTDFRNALEYLKPDGKWAALPSTLPSLDGTGTLQVRVVVYNDDIFESGLPNGPEKFTLTATYTDYASKSATAVGTATIYDDGTGDRLVNVNGDPDPDTVALDDDTPVYVSSPVVNEASQYVFFDVEGTPGRVLTLSLAATTASPTNRPATIPGNTLIQYSLDGGSSWNTYSDSSKPTIPDGGDVLVRVLITAEHDTVFEGPETFTLTASPDSGVAGTGTATIIDNGTGPVYNNDGSINPSATPDDDRPLSVTSPTVSESSPYAVFTVTAAPGQTISLQLAGVTALIGPGTGSDFGPSIEINTGSGWVAYTPGDSITVPANGQLLARTPITPDNRYEGPETFTLTATYTSGGSKSSVGTATITDDGTSANTFEAGNTTGTATQGTADNDKPLVSVSSITVSESSPFAVVEVSLSNPSNFAITFTPALVSGTATAGVDTTTTPSGDPIEFFNGTAWVSAASGVTLAAGATSVLLRTAIVNDSVFEGPESLQISTGPISGTVKNTAAASGTITITDDGTSGQRFEANTNSKVPDEGTPDNDKPTISITPNLTVSEAFLNGDPNYAVVKVSLTNTSTTAVSFSPSLESGSATLAILPIEDGGNDDFGPDLEVLYLDASGNPIGTWATVSGAVSIAAGRTQLLLRTKINNDTAYEIAETFKIKTNATTGVKNPLGVESTVTITDDGRANVSFFTADNTSGNGTTGTSDDDRKALFVSGGTFNEGSKFAIFTVGNTPGNQLNLSVRNGTASVLVGAGGSQPTILFSTDGGTTWQTYSSSNKPTAPTGSGEFLVAVDISNEADAIYEGPELFFLDAVDASDATKTASGSATIVDDGSGSLVKLRGNGDPDASNNQFVPDTTTTPDDDRPTISVGSITVSESSPYAVVKVLLSNLSNYPVFFTPSLLDGSAEVGVDTTDTDTGGDLEYFDGSNWVSTASGVTIAAGTTHVLLRAKIVNDNTYEGPETLQVATGAITGAVKNGSGANGTITITDDGTSGARFEETTNSDTPSSGTPDNDIPTVSVSSITVSEASPFAVVEVSLNKFSKYPISFTPSLTGVTATVGVDTTTTPSGAQIEYFNGSAWVSAASGVTLAPGTSSVLLRTAILQDDVYEGQETLRVNTGAITVGSGAVTNPGGAFGVVTITDDGSSTNTFPSNAVTAEPVPGTADNDTPQISVTNVTVSESSPFAVVRVELTNPKSSKYPISFTPSLLSGTATAGVDTTNTPSGVQIEFFNGSAWVSAAGGVTLAPGVTSVLLRTAIVNDSVYEGPESLQIRTGPINVGTAGGAVTNPLGAAGTITITDNGTNGDRFEAGNTTPTPTQGTPDDDRPVITITPLATVGETQDGTTRIVNFSINLSKSSTSTITVNYSTSTIIPNGVTPLGWATAGKVGPVGGYIATSGVDFAPINNLTATFLPGTTSLILPSTVIGDDIQENTESYFIVLSNASSNAKLGDGSSEIAIFDNDGPDGNNLNYDFRTATTPVDLRGGNGNDTIFGGISNDVLSGDPPTGTLGGDDVITGNLGSDTITGGPGNDRFVYNSFAESTINSLDRIRDFTPGTALNPTTGDRIDLATLPTTLYNRGVISGVSTAAAAFAAAFADVNSGSGTQALGANQAVLFAFDTRINGVNQRNFLLAVNDGTAARNDATDLLINVTGLAGAAGFSGAATSTATAAVTINRDFFFV